MIWSFMIIVAVILLGLGLGRILGRDFPFLTWLALRHQRRSLHAPVITDPATQAKAQVNAA